MEDFQSSKTLSVPNWRRSEENRAFRSQVVQWLIHQPNAQCRASAGRACAIPRVIVQFWHDSANIPDDVGKCLDSWERLRDEGFERRLFDDAQARNFIARNFAREHVDAFDLCHHPAMRCDYFRMCYILRNGGFYVDADEVYQGAGCDRLFLDNRLKIRPLCFDMSKKKMAKTRDLLIDTEFPSARRFYLANDPIIAPADHPALRFAVERSTRILLQRLGRPDIQSTTGPGNLTAGLVRHVIRNQTERDSWDFAILHDWERIAASRWSLGYRKDARNWRLLNAR